MKKLSALVCVTLLALAGTSSAQDSNVNLDVNDFLPVVAGGGGTTVVKRPEAVAIAVDPKLDPKKEVVTAASAQDAINVAVGKNKSTARDIGCIMVKFPSGMGCVATGTGTYRNMENPVATRISKRQAYVAAFVVAKKNLAEFLKGTTHDGVNAIAFSCDEVDKPEESATNLAKRSDEEIAQLVDAVVRGFTVYSIEDDVAEQTVYVSIVSTSKTMGKLSRVSNGYIEAQTLRDGLRQVFAEIESGLVPPVGGRAIQVMATGETALVGFGCAVVGESANKALSAQKRLVAAKIADVRAKDALCGLIVGDRITWAGGVSGKLEDGNTGFVTNGDPIDGDTGGNVQKLDAARQSFFDRTRYSESYISARKGKLPPGVNKKGWFDADGGWACAVAVYLPSATRSAADFAKEMDNATIVRPTEKTEKDDGGTVERGPSGQVSRDKDL